MSDVKKPLKESYAQFRHRVLMIAGREAPLPEEKKAPERPEGHELVESTNLYYTNPAANSDKVYIVELIRIPSNNPSVYAGKFLYFVNFSYGPRGGTMKSGTKTPTAVDEFDARKKYRKLINEKRDKGYVDDIHGGLISAYMNLRNGS